MEHLLVCQQCDEGTETSKLKPIYDEAGDIIAHICNSCRLTNVENARKCHLAMCPSVIEGNLRHQHFRTLPAKFYEMPDSAVKRSIITQFGINKDTRACCNKCYLRLSKAVNKGAQFLETPSELQPSCNTGVEVKAENEDSYAGPLARLRERRKLWLFKGKNFLVASTSASNNILETSQTTNSREQSMFLKNSVTSAKSLSFPTCKTDSAKLCGTKETDVPSTFYYAKQTALDDVEDAANHVAILKSVLDRFSSDSDDEPLQTLRNVKIAESLCSDAPHNRKSVSDCPEDFEPVNRGVKTKLKPVEPKRMTRSKVNEPCNLSCTMDNAMSLVAVSSVAKRKCPLSESKLDSTGYCASISDSKPLTVKLKRISSEGFAPIASRASSSSSDDLQIIEVSESSTMASSLKKRYKPDLECDFSSDMLSCVGCNKLCNTRQAKAMYDFEEGFLGYLCSQCRIKKREMNKTCRIRGCNTPATTTGLKAFPNSFVQLRGMIKRTISSKFGINKEVRNCCANCFKKLRAACLEFAEQNANNGNSTLSYTVCGTCEKIVIEKHTVPKMDESGKQVGLSCYSCCKVEEIPMVEDAPDVEDIASDSKARAECLASLELSNGSASSQAEYGGASLNKVVSRSNTRDAPESSCRSESCFVDGCSTHVELACLSSRGALLKMCDHEIKDDVTTLELDKHGFFCQSYPGEVGAHVASAQTHLIHAETTEMLSQITSSEAEAALQPLFPVRAVTLNETVASVTTLQDVACHQNVDLLSTSSMSVDGYAPVEDLTAEPSPAGELHEAPSQDLDVVSVHTVGSVSPAVVVTSSSTIPCGEVCASREEICFPVSAAVMRASSSVAAPLISFPTFTTCELPAWDNAGSASMAFEINDLPATVPCPGSETSLATAHVLKPIVHSMEHFSPSPLFTTTSSQVHASCGDPNRFSDIRPLDVGKSVSCSHRLSMPTMTTERRSPIMAKSCPLTSDSGASSGNTLSSASEMTVDHCELELQQKAKSVFSRCLDELNKLSGGRGRKLLSELCHPNEYVLVRGFMKVLADFAHLYQKAPSSDLQERIRLLSLVARHTSNDVIQKVFKRFDHDGTAICPSADEIERARQHAALHGPGAYAAGSQTDERLTSVYALKKDCGVGQLYSVARSNIKEEPNFSSTAERHLLSPPRSRFPPGFPIAPGTVTSELLPGCFVALGGKMVSTPMRVPVRPDVDNRSLAKEMPALTDNRLKMVEPAIAVVKDTARSCSPVFDHLPLGRSVRHDGNKTGLSSSSSQAKGPMRDLATYMSGESSSSGHSSCGWKASSAATRPPMRSSESLDGVGRSDGIARRSHVLFSLEEEDMLEAFYLDSLYTGQRQRLCDIQKVVNHSKGAITTWFRNRRHRNQSAVLPSMGEKVSSTTSLSKGLAVLDMRGNVTEPVRTTESFVKEHVAQLLTENSCPVLKPIVFPPLSETKSQSCDEDIANFRRGAGLYTSPSSDHRGCLDVDRLSDGSVVKSHSTPLCTAVAESGPAARERRNCEDHSASNADTPSAHGKSCLANDEECIRLCGEGFCDVKDKVMPAQCEQSECVASQLLDIDAQPPCKLSKIDDANSESKASSFDKLVHPIAADNLVGSIKTKKDTGISALTQKLLQRLTPNFPCEHIVTSASSHERGLSKEASDAESSARSCQTLDADWLAQPVNRFADLEPSPGLICQLDVADSSRVSRSTALLAAIAPLIGKVDLPGDDDCMPNCSESLTAWTDPAAKADTLDTFGPAKDVLSDNAVKTHISDACKVSICASVCETSPTRSYGSFSLAMPCSSFGVENAVVRSDPCGKVGSTASLRGSLSDVPSAAALGRSSRVPRSSDVPSSNAIVPVASASARGMICEKLESLNRLSSTSVYVIDVSVFDAKNPVDLYKATSGALAKNAPVSTGKSKNFNLSLSSANRPAIMPSLNFSFQNPRSGRSVLNGSIVGDHANPCLVVKGDEWPDRFPQSTPESVNALHPVANPGPPELAREDLLDAFSTDQVASELNACAVFDSPHSTRTRDAVFLKTSSYEHVNSWREDSMRFASGATTSLRLAGACASTPGIHSASCVPATRDVWSEECGGDAPDRPRSSLLLPDSPASSRESPPVLACVRSELLARGIRHAQGISAENSGVSDTA